MIIRVYFSKNIVVENYVPKKLMYNIT